MGIGGVFDSRFISVVPADFGIVVPVPAVRSVGSVRESDPFWLRSSTRLSIKTGPESFTGAAFFNSGFEEEPAVCELLTEVGLAGAGLGGVGATGSGDTGNGSGSAGAAATSPGSGSRSFSPGSR